jgi:dihydrofolate reductase
MPRLAYDLATMTRVRFNITVSADGYVAGPDQSLANPLGEGGERLHEWAFATRAWREMQGMDGGESGTADDVVIRETFENLGATIMGRHMFAGSGPWDPAWRGWWGENPPYHHPVFVLTHHAREPLPMKGGTTFHFVTGGIHEALARATEAAAGKDISLAGGANAAQQFLAAGLVDEMELHIAPALLGGGERLFENTDGRQTGFECVRVLTSPLAAHFKYRRA